MKAFRYVAASATTIAMVGVVLTNPAFANESDGSILDILTKVSAAATSSEQRILSDVASESARVSPEHALSVRVATSEVIVPTDPADGILLAGQVDFAIGLPFATQAADATHVSLGIASFDNGNGSNTVPVVKSDGSVQIITIIESTDAPTRYGYELGLPAGAKVEMGADGQVSVHNEDGIFLAGATAPWATDANGAAVPTRYELTGSTLTQVIDHNSTFDYPIVADPWWGQSLLSSAWMSFHIGYYVVNATATAWGRTWNGLATHASHVAELKQRIGGTWAYVVDTNGGTIREQFLCHVAGNYFEQGVYNMESYQPARHWAGQLNPWDRCNILKQAP